MSCLRSVFVSEFEWLITTSLFAQRRGLAQLRRASRLKALEGDSPSEVSRSGQNESKVVNIYVMAVICTNGGS